MVAEGAPERASRDAREIRFAAPKIAGRGMSRIPILAASATERRNMDRATPRRPAPPLFSTAAGGGSRNCVRMDVRKFFRRGYFERARSKTVRRGGASERHKNVDTKALIPRRAQDEERILEDARQREGSPPQFAESEGGEFVFPVIRARCARRPNGLRILTNQVGIRRRAFKAFLTSVTAIFTCCVFVPSPPQLAGSDP